MSIGLGLDVGGTKILACAVTHRGELVAETRVDSPRRPDRLLEALTEAADSLVTLVGSDRSLVTGVGVGVPSLVARDGSLFDSPNLPAMSGLPVHAAFADRLVKLSEMAGPAGQPWRLVLDNDATCAAAGELAFGAARGESDVAVVTLGTGIGGGIVSGGQLQRGARGFAAEFGHMVIDPDGPPCHCGRSGCFEQFASGSALTRFARRAARDGVARRCLEIAGGDPELLRGEHVLAAALEGDEQAVALFAEVAGHLAVGLGNLVEILDPARVILGGGLAEAGTLLLTPTVDAFASTCRRGRGEQAVPIVVAALGERSGAYGAAALGMGLVA